MNAFWFWLQVVVAAVCVGALGVGVGRHDRDLRAPGSSTFPQVITALFFLIRRRAARCS